MPDFDSFDYSIEKRLPEWWKGFGALEPVNKYTQDLIAQILQGLFTTMGVIQPLNCWLTIPEEYNWYHHYQEMDDMIKNENNNGIVTNNSICTFFPNDKVHVEVPNTKRNCHAKIKLKLLGTEVEEDSHTKKTEIIDSLTIQNANQIITLRNISTTSTIEILTETNEILIDGEEKPDLIEGKIDKIRPTIKNAEYQESYIDKNGNIQYRNIDIENENKKTEIIFSISNKIVNFDLQIYLLKPTYTTEQNIQIASVSAFPIESVELYGYFCHPFNNKAGYKRLWKKEYTKKSRTVYDRITKQYDSERFCIEVKYYGIETPLRKGFPQETNSSNPAFQPNPMLDKWGKIYGLQRRIYKTDITEDEEPFTFPKYYTYPIEQDYWYEQRMVNEYRFDADSINSVFVKDDEFNNIGMLECIYPYMNDIWVYTETIDPKRNKVQKVQNDNGGDIPLCSVTEKDNSLGTSWENPEKLKDGTTLIKLNPKSNADNYFTYQTKMLKCSFCLNDYDEETPKNITIKGIELKFKTSKNVQSNTIRLSEDSKIILPYQKNDTEYVLEPIDIVTDKQTWLKDKGYFTIGGEDNLFQEKEISREQLFKGNDGKVEFELGFVNENDFIESILYIENVTLNIYYEVIPNEYSVNVEFDKKEINLRENDNHRVIMQIYIKNTGQIEVYDKEITIILPSELELQYGCDSYKFDLNVGEKIGDPENIDTNPPIEVAIKPKRFDGKIRSGKYDILVICEDKVITNEILIRGEES